MAVYSRSPLTCLLYSDNGFGLVAAAFVDAQIFEIHVCPSLEILQRALEYSENHSCAFFLSFLSLPSRNRHLKVLTSMRALADNDLHLRELPQEHRV